MQASYRWLTQLVPGLDADPKEVARRLTHAGIEVESLHAYGAGAEACVIAWVVSSRPHPSKSGLRLVTVDRGGAMQEVVCGAPNVPEPGGVVVLAPLGARLPAKDMTIARREIGGVVSEGMLCSEAELGLTDDASGILVLPPALAAPGTKLTDAIEEASDTILGVSLTPNRPDGLGHIGLAREIAALFELPWRAPRPEAPLRVTKGDAPVRVEILEPKRCAHYAAMVALDVTVRPSPLSVRYRLASLGVRPISNAVDVTNVILLLYGHPMHAFDLDRVRGGRVVVRLAKEGEELTTLDGVTRACTADDLLICDGEGPIALAGVMGGASSEITSATKRVLLECAYFDPRSVRRTSRRHGLHSESSHRFERGVDWGDTRDAIAHAASMTARLGGGSVVSDVVMAEGEPLKRARVTLRSARCDQLLGVHVPEGEAKAILARLGFEAESGGAFIVPSHRPDVAREVDLIEEVARVRGMDKVPTDLPAIRATSDAGPREALYRRARRAAEALGLSEALTYAFTSPKVLESVRAPAAKVILQNPLSVEQSVMRTSLLGGLLEAVSRARRHGERDVRLYTTGAVFLEHDEERASFAATLAGDRDAWLSKPEPLDVWDAKGIAERVVERLVGALPEVKAFEAPHLHPRAAGLLLHSGAPIGSFGALHPDVIDAMDTGPDVMVIEIDLDRLSAVATQPRYAPIPRFPAATRDIALVVQEGVRAGDVEAAVKEAAGPLAESVALFDRFTGGALAKGTVSLALRVVYRSPERTLTDSEVDASHARVVEEMARRFGATLRA